jgi:hypothetical protein
MKERVLHWDGCTNVCDLGGLRTTDGRTTRWGALVRSDTPGRLSAAGYGVAFLPADLVRDAVYRPSCAAPGE